MKGIEKMKKINLNVIIGIFLLVIGFLVALETLNVGIDIDYSITGWSFLSAIGILMMVNDKKVTTVPSILVFVGIWNVLNEVEILNGSIFSLIWPIILIIVGANLVFGRNLFNKAPLNVQNNADALVYNGIFSGVSERLSLKDFKGLTANAIFGGVELDLRDVEITDNVQIDISALFGGVTMILPEKYNIVMGESLALFGGTENKFKGKYDEKNKTIYINCRAIFGGAELK
jgi:hypothetical protein